MGDTMLFALIIAIGVAGELYRLLNSDERLTARTLIARCLLGVLASLAVLAARAYKPDLEDATLVGLAALIAVLGYSFLEGPIKAAVRGIFKRFTGEVKSDDAE
ncbi:hypothetical protein [Lelliottia nimipressuralis]|uniref:hypothetical protein n=1 Tax=Lelliottia nimipressuralis TaxID=69220 RepID=UPI00289A3BB1|nr:hypothetical protein [Lelliottia nimipressuralis]